MRAALPRVTMHALLEKGKGLNWRRTAKCPHEIRDQFYRCLVEHLRMAPFGVPRALSEDSSFGTGAAQLRLVAVFHSAVFTSNIGLRPPLQHDVV